MSIDPNRTTTNHSPPVGLCQAFQRLTSPHTFLKEYEFAAWALLKRTTCVENETHAKLTGKLETQAGEVDFKVEFDQIGVRDGEVHLFREGRRAYTDTTPMQVRYNRKAIFVPTSPLCIDLWRLFGRSDRNSFFYQTDRFGAPVKTNYGWKCTSSTSPERSS